MFGTVRRLAPLLSSLLVGAAASTGVILTTGVIAGCADENDPETHVKRLTDVAQRAAAVNRLIQFFEDAMTKDSQNREGANVKPLLDKIVQPMNEACVAGDLDDRTNKAMVKFLSDARDPRGEACLVKALKDYKPDSTEDDVRAAARAIKGMKLKSAAGPLFDVFKKIHHSKPKAASVDTDVAEAMFALVDPSWEGEMVTMLGHPVDPKEQTKLVDEMYWQVTSARCLGLMKSAQAVKPLIKIMVSPFKAAAAPTAILGLIKIGKPAIGPAVAMLKGEDKELVDYAKGEALKTANGDAKAAKGAETAHIGAAAIILGSIGREDSAAPLLDALTKTDDLSRAIIARELYKVPKSATTVKAFQDAFDKTPLSIAIPGASGGARESLLESAGYFYDPSFVPWILKGVKDLKGEEADQAPVRDAAMGAILKLVTSEQLKLAEELVNMKTTEDGKPSTVGKGYDKEWKQTKDALAACGDKVDCWVGKMSDPAVQNDEKQFTGIKAAYMVGAFGKAETRQQILAAMPKITHPAIRFAAVTVIDYLSPKGDTAIATELQKMVDDAQEKRDEARIRANGPLPTVIYRLNARAQN